MNSQEPRAADAAEGVRVIDSDRDSVRLAVNALRSEISAALGDGIRQPEDMAGENIPAFASVAVQAILTEERFDFVAQGVTSLLCTGTRHCLLAALGCA